MTVIARAVEYRFNQIVNWAVQNSYPVDEHNLLHTAARWGNTDCVSMLLRMNADVAKKNDDGVSALEVARHFGRSQVETILRDAAISGVEKQTPGEVEDEKEMSAEDTQKIPDDDGDDSCAICMDAKKNCAFDPCGHLCCCA